MLAAAGLAAALGIGALIARGGPRSAGEQPATPDASPVVTPGTPPTPTFGPSTATRARPGDGSAPGATAGAVAAPLTARDLAALVNEAALMVRLRQLRETDPPLSLRLAREGNARFPNSSDAPERAFIVVKSLVDLARFKEAQQEARKMLKAYPNDPRTLDVERHLLSNPLE
jgi:hypothetical protein